MESAFKILSLSLAIGFANVAFASEDNKSAATGQSLHDAACLACHASKFDGDGTKLYKREDRKVKDMEHLNSQVARCSSNFAKDWSAEDASLVVQYLNDGFYHFDAK